MRVLTVTLMLLVIGLAGCAGDDKAPAPGDQQDGDHVDGGNHTADPTTNHTGGPDDNATEGQNATNEVPVLNFTADAINGSAPLLVEFALAVDDDSESLTWTFFVAGNETLNGTTFPAAFNYTFGIGTWNVSVIVDDGEFTVNSTLQIEVVQGIMTGAETFYIHATGSGNGYLDHTPAGGKEDGHGTVSLAGVPPYRKNYVAAEPTINFHPAGSSVEAHVQAFGLAPSPQTKMTGTLLVDGVVVGTATSEAKDVVTLALVSTPCTDWQIDFQITEDIAVGSTIEFRAQGDNVMRLAPCYPGGASGPRVILSA